MFSYNTTIRTMKKLLIVVAIMATAMSYAQKTPVGIVSVQDSVKGFRFGVISSIAPDGGYGLQFSGVSNTSGHLFNGLQLAGASNITTDMDKGLQLSGILNISSGRMNGWRNANLYAC